MFCSHCGKSILPEDVTCPHCGIVLGEDRFIGNMYTSSQMRLATDELEKVPAGSLNAYTRTDYMSYDNQPEDDVYSNTAYRPIYNEETDGDSPEDSAIAANDEPTYQEDEKDSGYDAAAPERRASSG